MQNKLLKSQQKISKTTKNTNKIYQKLNLYDKKLQNCLVVGQTQVEKSQSS